MRGYALAQACETHHEDSSAAFDRYLAAAEDELARADQIRDKETTDG